jgi:hypothetical protein
MWNGELPVRCLQEDWKLYIATYWVIFQREGVWGIVPTCSRCSNITVPEELWVAVAFYGSCFRESALQMHIWGRTAAAYRRLVTLHTSLSLVHFAATFIWIHLHDHLWHWRMAYSGMLHCVALVRTDVSEEVSVSIIRVTRIGELGTTLAVPSHRRVLCIFSQPVSVGSYG